MPLLESFSALVGNTPLLHLARLEKELNLSAEIFGKIEGQNPAGSVKDRAALFMINDAEKEGRLKEGGVLIEPTSGNTGIGICALAASRGYRAVIVMPDHMSPERRKLMQAYGAKVVLTDGKLGMAGAIAKASQLEREIPGSLLLGQFENPANAQAHYQTTGPEIWRDTEGNLDAFVAGIGTGGTFTGVGRYLKEQKSEIRLVAVEPASSAVLSGGQSGSHGLQGIGAGFIPEILDRSLIDEILRVTEEEAFTAARLLAGKEGILAGISSGAALQAAIKLAKREEFAGKRIVVLLPDTGERYLSTELFDFVSEN
ncbi:MAG: cysteine synthase A [Oscillospiraceae bacterium]|nr:cysteine synthase A [Oscillospiraceae bacterium]